MSGNSLEAMVKVIAYGVPALLIVPGFFAYAGGYTVRMLTGDVGMQNFGIAVMAIGIIIYVLEIVYAIYNEYR